MAWVLLLGALIIFAVMVSLRYRGHLSDDAALDAASWPEDDEDEDDGWSDADITLADVG